MCVHIHTFIFMLFKYIYIYRHTHTIIDIEAADLVSGVQRRVVLR